MPSVRRSLLILPTLLALATAATADDVLLKNKLLYRGSVDRDNTLRQVSDGLKRVIIRDSKIEKITPSDPYRNLERFAIVQPLEVHAGAMPLFAYNVEATPWNEKGRRQFSYYGPKAKARVEMLQAINDLGPHMIKFRGVDGFWVGQVSTNEVPKPIILGLLGRVDQKVLNERQRVARFLLQAGWYDEAKAAVAAIAKDFPAEAERSNELIRAIQDLDARRKLVEISLIRKSRRPAELLAKLRTFPAENVSPDVLADARDQLRREEAAGAADRRLGESIRELEKPLTPSLAKTWKGKGPIAEVLRDLEAAPDALRTRLDALNKAGAGMTSDARLALAMSGWIVGPDAAVSNLDDAAALWKARDLVLDYLRAPDSAEDARSEALVGLQTLEFARSSGQPEGKLSPETLIRIVQQMPPPLNAEPPPAEGSRSPIAWPTTSTPSRPSTWSCSLRSIIRSATTRPSSRSTTAGGPGRRSTGGRRRRPVGGTSSSPPSTT